MGSRPHFSGKDFVNPGTTFSTSPARSGHCVFDATYCQYGVTLTGYIAFVANPVCNTRLVVREVERGEGCHMTYSADIIVPTLGNRPLLLDRAISSILNQEGCIAKPIIVVNGNRYDRDYLETLRNRNDLVLFMTEEFGVSNARILGRKHVTAEFFAFLDDDDTLLPSAISLRIRALQTDEKIDVCATNGYVKKGNKIEVLYNDFNRHPNDPALALVEAPWLASAGALFRSRSIPVEVFYELPNFLEITKLALRISLDFKVIRLDIPTFIKHEGDARSQASKSNEYNRSVPAVLKSMEYMTHRKDLKKILRRRRSAAFHGAANKEWQSRRYAAAWRFHLHSMLLDGGLRYFWFSRKLFPFPKRLYGMPKDFDLG